MYINYMTKTYHNFLKSQEAKQAQAEPVSFADKIAEKQLEAAGTEQVEIVPKEMPLEKYKQYIYDQISQIPIHPSQMTSSFSVHISDAGFEAMKADPEYEKWVLDRLKYDFGFNNPWAGICGGCGRPIGSPRRSCARSCSAGGATSGGPPTLSTRRGS